MTPSPSGETVRYRRSRFSARLPVGHRYTRSHYWLASHDGSVWRVGLTPFATRMLGDLVECTFTLTPGQTLELGQKIGAIEGFKAISDLYAVLSGRLAGVNDALEGDITVVERSPFDEGWLYAVEGNEPDSLGVDEYVHVLDATIDRMLASRREGDPRG